MQHHDEASVTERKGYCRWCGPVCIIQGTTTPAPPRLPGPPRMTRRPSRRAPAAKWAGKPSRAARAGAKPAARPAAPPPDPKPATARRAATTPRRKAPAPLPAPTIRLYTADGGRKYITAAEREAFLREAEQADRNVRTLCITLAYAGCRLSEALALTADRVDLAAGVLVFATLKKAQAGGLPRRARPPGPGSMRSTWCTASASDNRAAARGAANGFGRGRA